MSSKFYPKILVSFGLVQNFDILDLAMAKAEISILLASNWHSCWHVFVNQQTFSNLLFLDIYGLNEHSKKIIFPTRLAVDDMFMVQFVYVCLFVLSEAGLMI